MNRMNATTQFLNASSTAKTCSSVLEEYSWAESVSQYYLISFATIILISSIIFYINLIKQRKIYVSKPKDYFLKFFIIIWKFRSIYGVFFTVLFDQASDIGVIIQLYYLSKQEEFEGEIDSVDLCESMNVSYLFYLSLFVFLFHRVVSSLLLYQVSQGNKLLTFLQIFDLTFIKSLQISYKFQSTEPPSPQVYLSNIEAMFERYV